MSLSTAIDQARRKTATTANRARQHRAERRMDEIVSVASIGDDYHKADRSGDLAVERQFQKLYALVDTEAEKEAVAAAFAVWVRDERIEELAVTNAVGESVELLKGNNDLFLADGCGPDGRAA